MPLNANANGNYAIEPTKRSRTSFPLTPQGPKVNTHNHTHTHTRSAQISTQGNMEGKVYNELAIESRGSSGSSYWDCVLCVIGNLNKLKLCRTHSTHTHIATHTREKAGVGVEWCEYVSRCTYLNVHMCEMSTTWGCSECSQRKITMAQSLLSIFINYVHVVGPTTSWQFRLHY